LSILRAILTSRRASRASVPPFYRKSHVVEASGANVQVTSHTFTWRTDSAVEAHQGVAFDGTYFYTIRASTIRKWNTSWVLQDSRDCSGDDPTDKTQLNHVHYKDGILYIGANNYDVTPKKGWIVEYNADDLTPVSGGVHSVRAQWGEGCAYHDGYFWVIYGDYYYVDKYDASWNLIATYDLPYHPPVGAGYQGCAWIGDYFYANIHEGAGQPYCDCYKWTGSAFATRRRVARPTVWCTQGFCIDPNDDDVWYWAERNYNYPSQPAGDNRVVKTVANRLTDYQIKVKVHYGSGVDSGEDVYLNGKCRSDFGDVRFAGSDLSELDYWVEEKVDGDYALFWVQVKDDLGNANRTIYVYYGDLSRTTVSNLKNTFMFASDFESDADLAQWTIDETGGSVDRVTSPAPPEGSYSVNLHDTGVQAVSISKYGFPNDDYRIMSYARQKSGVDGFWLCPNWGDAILDYMVFFAYRPTNQKWAYYDTAWHDIHNCVFDTWYKMEMLTNFQTKKFTITIDGSQYANLNMRSIAVADTGILFGSPSTQTGDGYRDLVIVAKYISPEPAHGAWGSEQRASYPF